MASPMGAVKSAGRSMTLFGVLTIIAGVLCMALPGIAGLSVITMIGILVLVAGIFRMMWAFRAGSFGRGLLVFAIGALTLLCGLILLAHPILASGVFTILLAVYFVVDGISEIGTGVSNRGVSGSGWLMFAGVVSIILGVMIWRQFPLSGMWAIGILFGIKLLFVGVLMLTGGSALRTIAKEN